MRDVASEISVWVDTPFSRFAAHSAAPTMLVNWMGMLAKGIIPRSAAAVPNLSNSEQEAIETKVMRLESENLAMRIT